MSLDKGNIDGGFKRLETVINAAADKIIELKKTNKEIKSEINELKRLLALSEKKAERLKRDLDELKSDGQLSWKSREKDIKEKLSRLSAKISAFESNYSVES